MKVVFFRSCVVSVVAAVALGVSGCGSKEKAPEVQQLEISVVAIGKKDVVLSSEFVGRT